MKQWQNTEVEQSFLQGLGGWRGVLHICNQPNILAIQVGQGAL
jgi:hypothetical protein